MLIHINTIALDDPVCPKRNDVRESIRIGKEEVDGKVANGDAKSWWEPF